MGIGVWGLVYVAWNPTVGASKIEASPAKRLSASSRSLVGGGGGGVVCNGEGWFSVTTLFFTSGPAKRLLGSRWGVGGFGDG